MTSAAPTRSSRKGIHYVDAGTSGGVWGFDRGFCLMIGGERDVVQHLDPIFATLAPPMESAPQTPARATAPSKTGTAEHGYLHCGPSGAGHFVKMVHNGIEYGVMAAYAEGLNILKHANIGAQQHEQDAETTPLAHPELYQYDFNIADVAEVWRRGSVIASWLLDLTANALATDPALEKFSGRVSDSGEGRWTVTGGDRRRRPGPRAERGALRTLQLARPGRLCESGTLGHAVRVRWPCGEEKLMPDVRIVATADELSLRAAEAVAAVLNSAVRANGRCALALSGGETPRALYDVLATKFREQIPWAQVHVFWGDERLVPLGSPERNDRMAREMLLSKVACPEAHIHPMGIGPGTPDDAARAYEETMRQYFSDGQPRFDLVLLGLGPEGHTASLFPHSLALTDQQRWVRAVTVPAVPSARLTLTLPVLSQAANAFFLVSGAGKAQALHAALSAATDRWSARPPPMPRRWRADVVGRCRGRREQRQAEPRRQRRPQGATEDRIRLQCRRCRSAPT